MELVSKLSQYNADPKIKDKMHLTPLFRAVMHNKDENRIGTLNVLLQAGANINAKNRDGRTPLHYAAEKVSRHDCIDFLLGVLNINAMDKDDISPLDLAMSARIKNDFELHEEEEANVITKKNTISKLQAAGGIPGIQID